jgi:hypothetical protein
MNTELNPGQSDTRAGDISLLGNIDLTGKENLLVKIVNVGGVAKFDLPASVDDEAIFILMSGDVAANYSAGQAPNLGENCRVLVDSTNAINPGDKLALSPNSWGKLYAPAAGAGAHQYTFIAEEVVAAGAVLVNPIKVRRIPDRAFSL